MKTIIASLILMFCFQSHATSRVVYEEFLGELNNSQALKMVLGTKKEFKKNFNVKCSDEEFESALDKDGRIELADVVICKKQFGLPKIEVACPKIYQPVCGEPIIGNVHGEKRMPEAITFSNSCEMVASRAMFLHEGECGAY